MTYTGAAFHAGLLDGLLGLLGLSLMMIILVNPINIWRLNDD